MITQYTSYGAVRAVLGVSANELADSVLDLSLYEVLLTEDLAVLGATMEADYAAAKALTPATALSTRFVRVLQAYASYQVAGSLLGSAAMFAPKDITDGKATVARVADPFKSLEASVMQGLAYIRGRLLIAYGEYSPANPVSSAAARTYVSAIGLAIDPVAG